MKAHDIFSKNNFEKISTEEYSKLKKKLHQRNNKIKNKTQDNITVDEKEQQTKYSHHLLILTRSLISKCKPSKSRCKQDQ